MKFGRLVVVAALAFAACENVVDVDTRGPLRRAFDDASAASGVPADLLLAVAYVETRWQVPETVDVDGDHAHGRGAVGIMGVVDRDDDPRLTSAAASLGMKPERARTDVVANVAVAAEVLRQLAEETMGAQPKSVQGWRPALALYGADGDVELGDSYADAVFEVLAAGASGAASTGEALTIVGTGESLGPQKIASALDADSALVDRVLAARDGFFTPGRWETIDRVVIHTTEGSYDGAISWFRSPNNPNQTSAHYVIRSRDGHITQMVDETDTAHHVRAWNGRAIGIEHEAISSQTRWFTDEMYRASAALVRDICQRHNIPMDREHIVGHVEAPGNNHSDPGRHWDWTRFMALVLEGATPAPTPPTPPADQCNGETYQGRCDGSTLVWCEQNQVKQSNCGARGMGCAWQSDDVGHNCVAAPAAPPVDPCNGESYQGRCDGNTLIWCENQTVRRVNCTNVCAWQSDAVGHNCQ
jgi:hypothetical protein